MPKNKNLLKAKQQKNDEFYTKREDIETELSHYEKFFKNKIVYCNCDNPKISEFCKFFIKNFKCWELKKLIVTYYEPNEHKVTYKLELLKNINNNEPIITSLPCDGDFRSNICIELLKEADIIVTNPPFSLFKEFIKQLIDYKKQFIIIGSENALCYKEIFSLIQENKVWFGYNHVKEFIKPDGTTQKFGNVLWYTNLDILKHHKKLIMSKKYNANQYPSYYNYDAIDVSTIKNIPFDYYGYMGVPITYMEQHNSEQFEIIGRGNDVPKTIIHTTAGDEIHFIDAITNEIVYKVPYTIKERKAGNSLRISENGKPGSIPYSRIIIRRKNIN